MATYRELKNISCPMDGIFFAFTTEQFKEGLEKCGYTKADVQNGLIIPNGYGGYGTKEAFQKVKDFYTEIDNRIRKECTPEEIYKVEFVNYECGYTGDDSEAIDIVNIYFPDWKPTRKE